MKYALNIAKFLVIVIVIITLINEIDTSVIYKDYFFTDKVENYTKQDTLHIYGYSNRLHTSEITISTLSGKTVFTKNNIKIPHLPPDKSAYKKGFPKQLLTKIALQNFQPGIYLINNRHPFVVSGRQPADITIIFPMQTLLSIDTVGGKTLINNALHSGTTTTQKPIFIDKTSTEFGTFIDSLQRNYSVNFTTDINLPDITSNRQTKVILLYGNCHFATKNILKAAYKQLLNGINYLVFSEYNFNNAIYFDHTKKLISTNPQFTENPPLTSWKSHPGDTLNNITVFGGNYTLGGRPLSNETLKRTTIAPKFISNNLKIKSDVWMGADTNKPTTYWATIKCQYNNKTQTGGIFVFHPLHYKGKVYHLGTSAWCFKNYNEISGNRQFLKSVLELSLNKNITD